jgi:hypothetical protein
MATKAPAKATPPTVFFKSSFPLKIRVVRFRNQKFVENNPKDKTKKKSQKIGQLFQSPINNGFT